MKGLCLTILAQVCISYSIWKLDGPRDLVPWTAVLSVTKCFAGLLLSMCWLKNMKLALMPTLVPVVRVTRVFPTDLCVNILGAFTSYQSFLAKGSWAFFFPPFFPLLIRLFLPTCHMQEAITSRINWTPTLPQLAFISLHFCNVQVCAVMSKASIALYNQFNPDQPFSYLKL